MLALVLALALSEDWSSTNIKSAYADGAELVVANRLVEIDPPKLSPLQNWEFQNETRVSIVNGQTLETRFRIFAQKPLATTATPASAGMLLARLYDFNMSVLRLDHSPQYQNRQINVYLCNAGQAGGQQLFGQDNQEFEGSKGPQSVNTIYLYEVGTLDSPAEACRELAHEYGHATLPPVRIKGGREDWANGHLGERIYMFNLAEQLKANKISESSIFGAKSDDLQRYLKAKVYPLIKKVASAGPNLATLAKSGDTAFEAYLSLACYAYSVLPNECFRRALILNPNETATGFAKSLIESINERPNVELKAAIDVPIWVPVGTGKLVGGKVLEKASGWAKVLPKSKLIIKNDLN